MLSALTQLLIFQLAGEVVARGLALPIPGPVLGMLFRSQEFIRDETELVILVTPHLAAPVDASRVALPTDNASAPSDAEFYLLGRTKGAEPGRHVPVSLGLSEGSFGHDLD